MSITKEYLEKVLNRKISTFEICSGSNLGDGYTSSLYSISINFQQDDGQVPHNFILKCFPKQLIRHEFLQKSNCFHREISMYKTFVPQLLKFQQNSRIKLPFPEIVYGTSIDYSLVPSDEPFKACIDPLENCIILPDLRKAADGGYHLADRLQGFDLDHLKLVVSALAELHALSWAYKQSKGIKCLTQEFPYIKGSFIDYMEDSEIKMMMDNSFTLFHSAVEEGAEGLQEKTELSQSLYRARGTMMDVLALYFSDTLEKSSTSVNKDSILRIPALHDEHEDTWIVALHGDTKLSNMLFRYDVDKQKPAEVKFIDLQFSREGDPMTDLVYTIYTTTNSEFRKKHLGSLLELYEKRFGEICKELNVAPPGGFDRDGIKKRFHRTKAFGFVIALIGFPIFLCEFDESDGNNWENLDADVSMDEARKTFEAMTKSVKKSKKFQTQVLDVMRELREQGVI